MKRCDGFMGKPAFVFGVKGWTVAGQFVATACNPILERVAVFKVNLHLNVATLKQYLVDLAGLAKSFGAFNVKPLICNSEP